MTIQDLLVTFVVSFQVKALELTIVMIDKQHIN